MDPNNLTKRLLPYPGKRCLDYMIISSATIPRHLICYQGGLNFNVFLFSDFIKNEKDAGLIPLKIITGVNIGDSLFENEKIELLGSKDFGNFGFMHLKIKKSVFETFFKLTLNVAGDAELIIEKATPVSDKFPLTYTGQSMIEMVAISNYIYGIYRKNDFHFILGFFIDRENNLVPKEDIKVSNDFLEVHAAEGSRLFMPIEMNIPFQK